MTVMKFGGTSIGTPELINNAIALISSSINKGAVLIASAMGKTTNQLQKIADEAGRGNDKEAFVTQDPFIWSDIDYFTLFVDPEELDNAIFQYEEGFISQLDEKDLSPIWIDEDAVVGVS